MENLGIGQDVHPQAEQAAAEPAGGEQLQVGVSIHDLQHAGQEWHDRGLQAPPQSVSASQTQRTLRSV